LKDIVDSTAKLQRRNGRYSQHTWYGIRG